MASILAQAVPASRTRPGRRAVTAAARPGPKLAPCAESSDTSGTGQPSQWSSKVCDGWSTAATTPRASPWSTTGPSSATSGRASWPTSTRRSRSRRCRGPAPASATRGGRPTGRPTTATPTPTSARPGGSRSCTTGSSRTSPPCGPSSRPRATSCVSETDTEVAAHLLEQAVVGGADLTAAMRGAVRACCRGPSPWSPSTASTPTGSSPPAATRRSWSGWARVRTSWPPTSPPSSSTPGGPSSWARTRWSP